jgi:hypothetical protein
MFVSGVAYTNDIPNPSSDYSVADKAAVDPNAWGRVPDTHNTKACWFFWAGFHLSDRRLYCEKPKIIFANNYRDPDRLSAPLVIVP